MGRQQADLVHAHLEVAQVEPGLGTRDFRVGQCGPRQAAILAFQPDGAGRMFGRPGMGSLPPGFNKFGRK